MVLERGGRKGRYKKKILTIEKITLEMKRI